MRAWFRLRYEGLEHIAPTGPAIVACNHISYLDPLTNASAIMKAGRRPRFLAKDDLFHIPLVGRAFTGAKQIPVVRGTGDATAALHAAERSIAEGEVVVIYPEGSVTRRPDHLPMQGKTGVVRLSLATGVPITPLVSWGSHAVWQKSGKGSLKLGRPVWLRAGPAIDLTGRREEADDVEAVRAMLSQVMQILTDMVEGLRATYPKRWSDAG
ncbi:MAG: 1-acyl-sn-glycerol-3-phosphate acyltransferase [Actinobacteria bacterium]|nr:1-acyl-sn-glycerol-3-phosphate acyltransferase [Actinomycetota bacterium]